MPHNKQQNITPPKNDIQTIKILLVEDDEISQTAATTLLRTLNCEVDIAEYGKDAVRLFENKVFDLVFMDIALIDMDGFTITEHFRRIEKEQKRSRVPIIAVSAYNDESFKKRASAVGVDFYLIKPISLDIYQKTLRQLNLAVNSAEI
ncbi:MAG: hypothetical protein A2X78_02655 [Gammaproteobacteria bacterium GWE2_37_16]|nr:MAG: hypothetical protein A2X78_02655 [Gammaproteobacteria bacterium GWE2_37_16]